jgi:NNP family nitrate/nitrite transporter-like MFS transporter
MGNFGLSIAVGLVAAFGDWRIPFWVLGIAAAAFGCLFLIIVRDAPAGRHPSKIQESFRILWRDRLCWALGLFYFLTFGGFVALAIFLPTLLKDIFGLTQADAGARVAGFVLLAVLMRPVGGWLADRYGGAIVLMVVFAAIGVLSFGLISSAIFVFTIGALGTAIALGLGNGAVFKLVPEYYTEKIGAASGLVSSLGGLGALFPPLILVVIRNTTGTYSLGFVLLALFAFGCLAVNYFVFGFARKSFSYQT